MPKTKTKNQNAIDLLPRKNGKQILDTRDMSASNEVLIHIFLNFKIRQVNFFRYIAIPSLALFSFVIYALYICICDFLF